MIFIVQDTTILKDLMTKKRAETGHSAQRAKTVQINYTQ